jgi:hypothetical protein
VVDENLPHWINFGSSGQNNKYDISKASGVM